MNDQINTTVDEEDDRLVLDDEDGDLSEIDDRSCLVGRFLTKRSIDCQAMQHKMASLWQPNRGLYVKELNPNHFLFQFYHEIDITRVVDGNPWTFDRTPLIFERVKPGENPRQISLNRLDVWIQCHDMKTGFMSESTLRHMANYIGAFVKSDPNNFAGVWIDYLRVCTTIDVEKPLKKKMTLEKKNGQTCTVQFKYTDLPTFCFICGKLGHSERFYDRLFDTLADLIHKMFDLSLKAAPRRRQHTIGLPWLRSSAMFRGSMNGGGENSQAGSSMSNNSEEKNQELIDPLHAGDRTQPCIYANSSHLLVDDSVANGKSTQEANEVANEDISKNKALLILENKRRRTGGNENLEVSIMDQNSGPNSAISGIVKNVINNGPPSIMNVLSWNCRGLGNQRTFQFLNEIISHKKPNYVFLCETKCKKDRVDWLGRALGFEGIFVVEANGLSGGLAFLWKNKDDGALLGFSQTHIDMQLVLPDGNMWRITGVYGEPIRNCRDRTWNLLKNLAGRSTLPWCVIGDLNNVLSQEDKKGGRPYPTSLIQGFQQCLDACGLEDMELLGYPFTWERGRGTGAWVEVRLDRALITHSWSSLFPDAKLTNLEVSSSNHCPLFLEPVLKASFHTPRRFRFENAWLSEPMCFQLVKDCWETQLQTSISGKISSCPEVLARWGKDITGDFKARIHQCKTTMAILKPKMDAASVQQYAEARNRLFEVLEQRETFWKQRAKQFLLKGGDKNSKYFHKTASSRKHHNTISKLKDDHGNWVDWNNGLPTVMKSYFASLFTTANTYCPEVIDSVSAMVPNFANEELSRLVTEEEDGCGDANIVLIPKKKNPQHMKELRPIALYNVLYKVITKVMTNRMKAFMDGIIADSQSAFVPGRLISNNVLVSFEVLHYLKRKRKGKTGFMALKLDMSKAYDRIEWPFLEAMLRKMGFLENWICLVMTCVSTAKYTVIHDAYEYERNGWLHGCKVANGAPRITHMLFADDSYLYCKATLQEAQRIQELLLKFESASGQQVNFAKSSIFFSNNTDSNVQTQICNYLHMDVADDGSFYLGLPSTLSRNKTAVLGFMREKVRKRLQSWEGKLLLKGGKEVLIKSVVQALPSYAMNVFLLPLEISNDIERAMCKFWWNTSKDDNKGIHWMAWDKLCARKRGGGMGFRNLRDFNLSLLGKQGWRLLTRPQSLAARLFKARYYPNGTFLNAQLGSNPSFVWRSILESQSLIRQGTRWCVGDGSRIPILDEPWLPHEENPKVMSSHPALENATVNALMKTGELVWDDEILADIFEDREQELIQTIPLNVTRTFDHLVWTKENSGMYSVKSAYALLQKLKGQWCNDSDNSFWRRLWQLKLTSKMQNLVWRACNNCLLTLVQLRTKHVGVSPMCPLCQSEEETIVHALITCREVQKCWNRVGIGTIVNTGASFLDWCAATFCNNTAEVNCRIVAICWAVWGARNNLVWNNKPFVFEDVVAFAFRYLDQWKFAKKSSDSSWPILMAADVCEQWTPPVDNSIKVNVDATIFKDGRLKFTSAQVDVAVAEAIGIREVLSWLKDRHWPQVSIETDSLCVVQALHSSIHMISLFGSVIQECKDLLASCHNVVVSFVK
uniref:Reverse transcriptase n=1 Tax=Cannabis sativa TaxID=3483 RepID=A0A803PW73_CANSA